MVPTNRIYTRWWFQIFFGSFTPKIGEDDPILADTLFKGVGSTTNFRIKLVETPGIWRLDLEGQIFTKPGEAIFQQVADKKGEAGAVGGGFLLEKLQGGVHFCVVNLNKSRNWTSGC